MPSSHRVLGLVFFTIFVTNGVGARTAFGQNCPRWVQRSIQPTGPAMRFTHAMVHDERRGVTVLFGGHAQADLGDTWEWDGNRWSLRTTEGPGPRQGHAMAFDDRRGVTVLFGGYHAPEKFDDTWEWNGVRWMLRSTSGPPPRWRHSMAYDTNRGVIVLFGGDYHGTRLGDTWEWDGFRWTQRAASGPSSRTAVTLVYDTIRRRCVLFGGVGPNGDLNDTWEWDGEEWAQVAESGPHPRAYHAMVFDGERGVSVLFGGAAGAQPPNLEYFADTWEWNGTSWTEVPGAGPIPRADLAMAFDQARKATMLFGGGRDGPSYLVPISDETWLWDGQEWSPVREVPEPRTGSGLVFDQESGRSLLFGGLAQDPALPKGTWTWDGTSWDQVSTEGPPGRYGHVLSYDERRHVVVMFGGFMLGNPRNETWEWDGDKWDLKSTEGPGRRPGTVMTYDARRGVTVLFGGGGGGILFGDTWEWDGESWSFRSNVGPAPRKDAAMTFDAAGGVCLLFGGDADSFYGPFFRDLWEWDGVNWALRSTTGPEPRSNAVLAFDSTRGVTLLVGGAYASTASLQYPSSMWQWDGARWTPAGPGPSTNTLIGAFDRRRRVLVVVDQGVTSEYLSCSATDSDGDGVFDADDHCPESASDKTLVIDGCDSNVPNHLFDDGCRLSDQIGDCEAGAGQHGEFVRCVAHLTRDWVRADIIDQREARAIRRCAARADIPPRESEKVGRSAPDRLGTEARTTSPRP